MSDTGSPEPLVSLKDLPHTSVKIKTNTWEKKTHNIYVAKQILIWE
jgi:hypothetical protein